MTSTPVEQSLLYQLADQLRVIEVAPAWKQVADDMRALDERRAAGADVASMEEQISHVIEYEAVLHRNLQLITDALLAGAIVGAFCDGASFRERVLTGLGVISRAFGFHDASPDAKRGVFFSIRRQAEDVVDALKSGAASMRVNGNDPPDEWQRDLRDRIETIVKAIPQAMTPATMRWRAWDAFGQRAFPIGVRIPPSLPELWAAAVDAKAALRARPDLDAVTVDVWSDMLAESLVPRPADDPQAIPPIIATVALARLRWSPRLVRDWLSAMGLSVPALGSYERERNDARVLAIRRDTESDLATWQPDANIPVIAFTPAQIDEFFARFDAAVIARASSSDAPTTSAQFNPFGALEITHLAVEGYHEGTKGARERVVRLRRFFGLIDEKQLGTPITYVYKSGAAVESPPSGLMAGQLKIGPKSARDLIREQPPGSASPAR